MPEPYNPQDWDRYSYVRNNPVTYIDPTGHIPCDGDGYCDTSTVDRLDYYSSIMGLTFKGEWSRNNQWAAVRAAKAIGGRFADSMTGKVSASGAFKQVYKGLTLEFCENCVLGGLGWAYGDHHIKFDGMYQNSIIATRLIIHEMGHVFDRAVCAANSSSGSCLNIWAKDGTARSGLTGKLGTCTSSDCLGRKSHEGPDLGEYWGFAGKWDVWQFGANHSNGEVWADMFLGWALNTWGDDSRGKNRNNYMEVQMQQYLALFY